MRFLSRRDLRTQPGVSTPGMDTKMGTALTRRFVLVLVVILVLESGRAE